MRYSCDSFKADEKYKPFVYELIRRCKKDKSLTVKEKYAQQGTLMLGIHHGTGMFLLACQNGQSIAGHCYILIENKDETSPLLEIFYSTVYMMMANGTMKQYWDSGNVIEYRFNDGEIYTMDSGIRINIPNPFLDTYISNFLEKSYVENRIDYLLCELHKLQNKNNVKRKINAIKKELTDLAYKKKGVNYL